MLHIPHISSLRQEHRGIHFDPFCLRETMAGGTADATADATGDSLGIYPEQKRGDGWKPMKYIIYKTYIYIIWMNTSLGDEIPWPA